MRDWLSRVTKALFADSGIINFVEDFKTGKMVARLALCPESQNDKQNDKYLLLGRVLGFCLQHRVSIGVRFCAPLLKCIFGHEEFLCFDDLRYAEGLTPDFNTR